MQPPIDDVSNRLSAAIKDMGFREEDFSHVHNPAPFSPVYSCQVEQLG